MTTLFELVSRYGEYHRVASTGQGEYAGPCPWCGGDDRFRVWPQAERPRYWCRQCDRKGDTIQFLRDHEGLSYQEACARVGQPVPERTWVPLARPQTPSLRVATPPSETWQVRAQAVVETCEAALWSRAGAAALAYLRGRGLVSETLRAAHVGYQARESWERPESWGLPAEHPKVYLMAGLVFPWYVQGHVWRVLCRRDGDDVPKDARYLPIAGGSNTLYGIDRVRPHTPVMLVEGVIDALSVIQTAGDLLTVVAGGTSGGRLERWIGRLSLASKVLLSHDADAAGDQAAAWWETALAPRAKRWKPMWDDANAMLRAGIDLRTWVREGLDLEPKWWRTVATWPDAQREQWEERVTIMEIDGGLTRVAAEQAAYADMGRGNAC